MKKKKEEMVNMTILVPALLQKVFKKTCIERGRTIKEVIIKAMTDFASAES